MGGADKPFDCVEMKRQIQARLLEETERLGEEELLRRHRQWLETSDDPLAGWWRSIQQAGQAARLEPAGDR